MSLLPVEPAWRLAERTEEQRWLIAGLWAEQAVGIVGGEPKCCKSFLALDIAVAVAAAVPCLRRSLDPVSSASADPEPTPATPASAIPPLLARLLDRQAGTGLPPPYLPKDEGDDP